MKTKLIFLALSMLGNAAFAQQKASSTVRKTPVDYVSMYIGTINPKTRGTVMDLVFKIDNILRDY